ncbi:MAG: phosphoribosylformylglycinamidine synthase subunit PurL [Planctomycetaceae bacterium]|nr:phosphoribosylformylglycinamidine synthase subunit PurL [Planctomycetaceae bacterium]
MIDHDTDDSKKTYHIEVAVRDPEMDVDAKAALHDLQEFGLSELTNARSARLYSIHGNFSARDIDRIASELLCDPVVEMFSVNQPVFPSRDNLDHMVDIARRPGVMEPSEASALKGVRELGFEAEWLRTGRRYILNGPVSKNALYTAVTRILANPIIEQVSIDTPLKLSKVPGETSYHDRQEIVLDGLSDEELEKLSLSGQLYMSLEEMQTVQAYYRGLGRNPTDIELETIAQTWSEHCSHKTFRGKVRYRENGGEVELIDNLLKTTVAKVTRDLDKEWCWSVFEDNSGVIDFNGEIGVAFKVETHNHPSAIEPYGGAGTGIGGVIRDPLGTGLGGKPILNTDVFCFGPPDLPQDEMPQGALHPLRVFKGVVAGVRDYGNRMGIPTANGAICFDKRFIGNPLVFCGNLAVIPKEMAKKRSPKEGEIALVVGGRTGRDGIHGATFSSVELDENSEMMSSGAVQIGNPIEEKKVTDFLLRARDAALYSCITDCGAGGLSSALGEMGEHVGVQVELDKVPLKYDGLTYYEIWISEAQERMVISTDPSNLPALQALAKEENVEITPIATFTGDHHLSLLWKGHEVGRLDMEFLHDGIPMTEREAEWVTPTHPEPDPVADEDYTETLKKLLSSWDICSKEWVIRQYDHEVQGGSVLKPLQGVDETGPGDAAVITPILGDTRAIAVSNGIKAGYSDIDPYWMAAMAIDEALRNLVAVGAGLERAAILDNFCWGNTNKPDRLGGLVRAAKACHDIALAYGTPFISGKDSLNNEFAVGGDVIAIPGTLLISAVSVMPDCRKAVSMDLKREGSPVYLVGLTANELGASHYYMLRDAIGNTVPKVDPKVGMAVFTGLHNAMQAGTVLACHDCSEGGFAVAAAEMAFSGGLGLEADVASMAVTGEVPVVARLFGESASRLIAEVDAGRVEEFEKNLRDAGAPFARIGTVAGQQRLVVKNGDQVLVDADIESLKTAWRDALNAVL